MHEKHENMHWNNAFIGLKLCWNTYGKPTNMEKYAL